MPASEPPAGPEAAYPILPPAPQDVRRVAVIGAGTMGAGIAAHLANVGFDVSLLDVSHAAAEIAFARAKAAKPPLFMSDAVAAGVRLGGLEGETRSIGEADWVVEAVSETYEVKRDVYAVVSPLLRGDALLSTNTSGLEIARLAAAIGPAVAPKFVGTHFFNPPRHLKLLELIPHAGSDPAYVALYRRLLEGRVARRVVEAKDTPGFIANRYGMWALFHAIHCAERIGLGSEETDALTGEFLERPRSGTFRLADVIGLDVMADVARNLLDRCRHDPQIGVMRLPRSTVALLERGWVGEKSSQGYTRREANELLVFDAVTGAYRQRREPDLPRLAELRPLPLARRLAEAMAGRDAAGEFLRLYIPPILQYAERVRGEVSHSAEDFDRVMRWGWGWGHGPLELADLIRAEEPGAKPFYVGRTQLAADGDAYEPRREEPEFRGFEDFHLIAETPNLQVRDLGDGITGLGIRTKMGTITPDLLQDLKVALAGAGPFVLHGGSRAFSVGYDLNIFLALAEAGDLAGVEARLVELQELGALLGSKPVVAAVRGYCLGAGYELAASCGRIVADSEAKVGLPEAKVGLIPGGRGTALMRLRAQGANATLVAMVAQLAQGTVSENAVRARELGYLGPSDLIEFHPDRLAAAAREALGKERVTPAAWATLSGPVVGQADNALRGLRGSGAITLYDEKIGEKIKNLMLKTGSFEEALAAERREFLDLVSKAPTVARMRHMLANGKPLRN